MKRALDNRESIVMPRFNRGIQENISKIHWIPRSSRGMTKGLLKPIPYPELRLLQIVSKIFASMILCR